MIEIRTEEALCRALLEGKRDFIMANRKLLFSFYVASWIKDIRDITPLSCAIYLKGTGMIQSDVASLPHASTSIFPLALALFDLRKVFSMDVNLIDNRVCLRRIRESHYSGRLVLLSNNCHDEFPKTRM